jgi:hypothetical protein
MVAVHTIYESIDHLFDTNEWICSKTPTTLNYKHKIASLEEYSVSVSEANKSVSEANKSVSVSEANISVSEANKNINTKIDISIPLNDINYKTTCYNLNDAINYVTWHRVHDINEININEININEMS